MTYLPYMADKKYKQRSEEEMNRLKQRNKNILEKVKQWQSFPYVKPMVCRNEKCEECKLKPKETRTRIMLQCPKCGFRFDISYGRAFACSGCPSVVQCSMAKCPKCGYEFPV